MTLVKIEVGISGHKFVRIFNEKLLRNREEVDPNASQSVSRKVEVYFPIRPHKGIKNGKH